VTATSPLVWSSAIFGSICELVPASSLTWVGALQLAPSSSEVRTKMSKSLLSAGASSV
jgi:hypothetical protein